MPIAQEDSPTRCQGIGHHGAQCWNESLPNERFCNACSGRREIDPEATKKQWLIEQFEKRAKFYCEAGEEIKLLRENLGSINSLIAARLSIVVDVPSLIANSPTLSQLFLTAEKITASLVKLEREADELLAKTALIKWGQRIGIALSNKIEGKFDGWEDTLLELSDEIGQLIADASNKEEDND